MRLVHLMRFRKLRRILAVALPAALFSCGSPSASTADESVPVSILQSLEGNYAMKTTDQQGSHYSTAVVKKLDSRQFQIARITVYGPVYYSFSLDGTSVESAELGRGDITYKPAIKKTTIRFQKQEIICELSR